MSVSPRRSLALIVAVMGMAIHCVDAFQSLQPASTRGRFVQHRRLQQEVLTKHYIFGRNDHDDDKDDDKDADSTASGGDESQSQGGVLPFFSRLFGMEEEVPAKDVSSQPPPPPQVAAATLPQEVATSATPEAPAPVATAVLEKAPTPPPAPAPRLEDLSPVEQARALRDQAKKMRLEAEKMDAELTLVKISRMERELAHAKRVAASGGGTANATATEVQDLMRELGVLQTKLRGEAPPKIVPATVSSTDSGSPTRTKSAASTKADDPPVGDYFSRLPEYQDPFDEKVFEGVLDEIKSSPNFMKKAMAAQVDVDYDTLDTLNITEVAVRLDKMSRFDFAFGGYARPSFPQSKIDERVETLRQTQSWTSGMTIDPRLKDIAAGNETEWALLSLEYEYFMSKYSVQEEELEAMVKEDEVFGDLINQFNTSALDQSIASLYPKCTRKDESTEPTEAQVQQLMTDILPKAKFSTTAKPEKVSGGYIIRGTNRYENGDELIEAIDAQLAKSSLGDKMTILFTKDFTVFGEPEVFDDGVNLSELDPILYILGPDIVRESRRAWLSVTTGLGLSTCWYLSLYPFLLNPTLSTRVEEELALVDAGMTPDLSWLTDLSLPLFVTFLGIQLAHEAGHRLTAAAYGFKPTFPTFVPSIITGVTSTVTSFKEPPKNKQAMFDFSVAGPLAGMVASLAALVIGSQLTLSGDPSILPALPVEILRQSSLGGGLIDTILGNGALSVPGGALGTQAVATMTIPLHPVAVAGYIGLIINALNMLPIGTTDGGRMALSVFGRGAKLLIGNLFLIATLVIGIGGSDLFLFYYAFCIAFQTGNEIPARNEVDIVDFSRVLVSVVAYALALLTLIPIR